jgi:hypothetical protein
MNLIPDSLIKNRLLKNLEQLDYGSLTLVTPEGTE